LYNLKARYELIKNSIDNKHINLNATGPVKFALDVEFKVDDVDNNGKEDGVRRVYYKQARPFGG